MVFSLIDWLVEVSGLGRQTLALLFLCLAFLLACLALLVLPALPFCNSLCYDMRFFTSLVGLILLGGLTWTWITGSLRCSAWLGFPRSVFLRVACFLCFDFIRFAGSKSLTSLKWFVLFAHSCYPRFALDSLFAPSDAHMTRARLWFWNWFGQTQSPKIFKLEGFPM